MDGRDIENQVFINFASQLRARGNCLLNYVFVQGENSSESESGLILSCSSVSWLKNYTFSCHPCQRKNIEEQMSTFSCHI